jgi:hypothetical protein
MPACHISTRHLVSPSEDGRYGVIKQVLRGAIDLAATAVVGGVGLAGTAIAQASAQPAVAPVYTLTKVIAGTCHQAGESYLKGAELH